MLMPFGDSSTEAKYASHQARYAVSISVAIRWIDSLTWLVAYVKLLLSCGHIGVLASTGGPLALSALNNLSTTRQLRQEQVLVR